MLRRTHLLAKHLQPRSRSSFIARMSTFTLPDTEISVKLTDDLTQEQLLNFPAFKNWYKTLQQNLAHQHTNSSHPFHTSPYALRSIKIQSIDRFSSTKIGFIKLTAEVTNPSDEWLPGAVFLRGASVGMMVLLQPDGLPEGSQEEKYVLLTVQPRIAGGSLQFIELPAGMVDDGTFKGSAAKEIQEEIGLGIPESEFINLTELAIPEKLEGEEQDEEVIPKGVFPSVGACDEFVPLFLYEKRVPRENLKEWEGRLTGLRDEGEKITLKLVRVENMWKEGARDAKALGAWALWEGLKREGKL